MMNLADLRTWPVSAYDILIPSSQTLPALASRLYFYKHEIVLVPERNSVSGPFADDDDFYNRALTRIPKTACIYRVIGHDVEIVVLEEESAAFEEVRKRRLAAYHAGNFDAACGKESLALPEDVILNLDQVPNSSLIGGRIWLLNRPNWLDEFTDYLRRREYGSKSRFVSACAQTETGDLLFFMAWNNGNFRFNLLHECCHFLHKPTSAFKAPLKYPREYGLFCDAVEIEWRDYTLDPPGADTIYSLTCYAEHWAVTGQQNLHCSGEEAVKAILNAPLRSFMFTRVLEMEMAALPRGRRPTCHQHYLARVRLAQITVRKQSHKCLESICAERGDTYLAHKRKGTLSALYESVKRTQAYLDEEVDRPMLENFDPSFDSSGKPELFHLTPPRTDALPVRRVAA